jgi:hypothetical protein
MASSTYPAWDQMTLEQKFAFLNELADNLADENRSLQVDIYSLLGKLFSVESKLSDLNRKLSQGSAIR